LPAYGPAGAGHALLPSSRKGEGTMFHKLMPREKRFFELLGRQTGVIQAGLELLAELVRQPGRRDTLAGRLKQAESDADEALHDIVHLLDTTFVTPFDREDIQLLTHRLDDVMDHAEAAGACLELYQIAEPGQFVERQSNILLECFALIGRAVDKLEDMKHRQEILSLCVRVNSLENDADELLRQALRGLFAGSPDPLHVIKMKEIHESLEGAIDRCEDIAGVLETILLKNA
jgi:predicted phosphate transport protein (TIGR00153 family)